MPRAVIALVALLLASLPAQTQPRGGGILNSSNDMCTSSACKVAGQIAPQIGSSITQSGALCNSAHDDTAAINTYLATLAGGSMVYVPPGLQCLINSANLSIPANVFVRGLAGPITNAYSPSKVSAILMNPGYTIILGQGAQLEGLLIQRSTLTPNPTASQVKSAVTTWGAERSIAVTLPANLGGQTIRDLFIIGFNTAIQANAGQFAIQHIVGDDYNGVEVTTAGDNATIDDVRFEPYYAFNTSATSGAWARPGIAFNFHDGDTLGGAACTRCFSFMWANGLVLNNVGVTNISNSSFEWQHSFGNGLVGAAGVREIIGCAACSVNNTYFFGFDTPVSDEVSNTVTFDGLNIVTATKTDFYLMGGAATPTTLTLGGRPAAGDTLSETLTSPSIIGSPLTITYKAIPGDTTASTAVGLQKIINSTQALIAARVSASVSGSVVTTNWPAATSITVTAASTGGITTRTSMGRATAGGSNGQIIGAQILTNGGVPAFTIGDTKACANAWQITAPNLSNGTGILPSGWLSWPTPCGGSIQEITVSGVQWSRLLTTNLSGCGTSPTVNNYASDARGTITEGTGSPTGCTLTFRTPFFYSPTCVVTNWASNSSQVSISSVSTTRLVVTNAATNGNKFTYQCQP